MNNSQKKFQGILMKFNFINLLALIILVVCTTNTFASDAAELAKKVAALPETTKAEKVKKALLQWALEDAQAAKDSGMTEKSDATLKDVETLLPRQIGQAQKTTGGLFPTIPNIEKNPVAADAAKNLVKISQSKTTYPKGLTNIPTSFTPLTNAAYEAVALIQGFSNPQSPLAGDASLIAPMMRRLEFSYEYVTPGSRWIADFGFSPAITEAYLLLKTAYPDLILPSRKIAWEKALTDNADAIITKNGQTFREAKPGTAYPNAQVKYITTLFYAGLLFNRQDYSEAAEGGMKLLESAMYPDGAFAYIGEQNEVFTYHGINVSEMARLWQITGNPQARRIVEKSKNYYPLSIEPPGVAEYASASSWKRYWNQIAAPEESMIVAYFTNDTQNMRVSKMNSVKATFPLAAFYRDDIQPAAAPDKYFVYDRNVQGVRGRFGQFSFVGTGREMPDENRGKASLVGAMILNPPDAPPTPGNSKTWTLNAALQDAASEVRVKTGKRDFRSTNLSLTRNDKNAVTVSNDFAALTSDYRLSFYNGNATDWEGRQAWIFTQNRLVGLVTLESLKDQNAFGMMGALTLVSGRAGWGTRKEFEKVSDNTFKYGALLTRFIEQDYGTILTEYTDAMESTNAENKAGRIVLLDKQSAENKELVSIHYPQGAKHFYLVEIQPESSKPAESIKRLTLENGLIGFEMQEGNRTFRLIYNPTISPVDYETKLDWQGKISLHKSGEQYRPAWIGADGKEEWNGEKPVEFKNGDVKITIPAGTHIVLVSGTN